jgi:hypothetical protein
MGISPGKEPVAIIDLDPNPAFVGETVSYDGSSSYDPDGSIVAYAWTFQGHSPASGTAVSGTLNYGTAGTYNITLTVTDGTSVKSSPARVQLIVNDGELEFYAATAGSGGVFYSDDAGQTYTAYNDSPATGDQAAAFAVVIDPATQHLPAASRTLWRAGQAGTAEGGIFASIDGGATWVTRRPTSVDNQWSDGTAPAIDDLTFRALQFVGVRLYAAATWQEGGGDYRSALFYTDDPAAVRIGGTPTWAQITTGWDD